MLKKIGSRIFKKKEVQEVKGQKDISISVEAESDDRSESIKKEFEEIRENRIHLQGSDFERAFAFLEKYPDHELTDRLIAEMNQTNTFSLKGLSYKSAVNIIEKMPDHLGAPAIIDRMYNFKSEYIKNLVSDVLIFMLEVAPDHPSADALATAVVEKNFTNAYNFINHNPYHPQTKFMISAMFKKDPNIAVLLLQEKMEHPEVESIIQGLYSLSQKDILGLTPNATLFVMDVVPDHQYMEDLVRHLVIENYLKAYEFADENPEFPHIEMLKEAIFRKKPNLKKLLWS